MTLTLGERFNKVACTGEHATSLEPAKGEKLLLSIGAEIHNVAIALGLVLPDAAVLSG